MLFVGEVTSKTGSHQKAIIQNPYSAMVQYEPLVHARSRVNHTGNAVVQYLLKGGSYTGNLPYPGFAQKSMRVQELQASFPEVSKCDLNRVNILTIFNAIKRDHKYKDDTQPAAETINFESGYTTEKYSITNDYGSTVFSGDIQSINNTSLKVKDTPNEISVITFYESNGEMCASFNFQVLFN